MERIYADLIRKGKKKLTYVPAKIRRKVKALLEEPANE